MATGIQQVNTAGHELHEERVLSCSRRTSTLTAANSPSFGIRSGRGTVDMPWLTALSTLRKRWSAMPGAPASSISTLPNESAPVQILDPRVQVVTGLPGARPDCQVSVAAAVSGSSHDDCPGGRRAVARSDAIPGELGG